MQDIFFAPLGLGRKPGKIAWPMTPANPPPSAFPSYLTSASLWMAGMTVQGFLFTWLLVGTLAVPADQAGIARTLAEFPALLVLLVGGVLGDRVEGRRYLGLMHALMALPPMLMIAIYQTGHLSYAWVVTFGVLMASIQALSDPARQAALSRVARLEAQRAVTIMTILTSGVGLAGFYLGAWLDVLGLDTVLLLQSALFASGILATRRLPDLSLPDTDRPRLGAGLRALWGLPLVRNAIALNFASSLFNAGAYIVAIPYIVTEIYAGDAAFFATVMIVFTVGSIGSNVLLLVCMPLRRPGRLFLVLQLTRAAILAVLWLQPAVWIFFVALFAWGLNMGITTTLVRTTVQELAPAAVRAQILSVLLLSFLVSSPISAALLGVLIAGTSPLTALLPGVVISLMLFAVGARWSGLWQYRYDGRPLEMP